jgi:hypothetical protein
MEVRKHKTGRKKGRDSVCPSRNVHTMIPARALKSSVSDF